MRDAIVHDDGEMAELPEALAQLLAGQPGVITLRSGQVVLQPNFVIAFTAACEGLLEAILDGWLGIEERRPEDATPPGTSELSET